MPARPSPRVGLIPAFVLLGVAAIQLALTHGAGLSPWLGGGFGMFSGLDRGGARHLHIFVLEPGLEREIFARADALVDREARVVALPSDARLHSYALAVAKSGGIDRARATGLRIQLWKTDFDPETLIPSDRILRQLEVRLDSG